MSKKYTFKPNLDGLNEELEYIVYNKCNPQYTKKEQKQRLYELFCEYLSKNIKLRIDAMLVDEEETNI